MGSIPDDVHALLARIGDELPAVLGDRLFGVYVYGSVSFGAFDAARGDIDCVAVTNGRLTDPDVAALRPWYRALLRQCPLASRLEMPYVPRDRLFRDGAESQKTPQFSSGKFFRDMDTNGHNPITWLNVKERGITLYGPEPGAFVGEIGEPALRNALGAEIGYIANKHPRWFRREAYKAYAVLTLCRVLYTLESGALCTKEAAAAWCLEETPAQWHALIAAALRDPASLSRAEIIRFADFAARRFQRSEAGYWGGA